MFEKVYLLLAWDNDDSFRYSIVYRHKEDATKIATHIIEHKVWDNAEVFERNIVENLPQEVHYE